MALCEIMFIGGFIMQFSMLSKVFGVICLMLVCSACGPSNTVPLTYPLKDGALLPSPNAPRIAVVLFTDKRVNKSLGTRSDNTNFEGTIAVPEWVSRSFADALSRRGAQVSFAQSLSHAKSGGATYIVTGSVTEAYLREVSMAELRAGLVTSISLTGPRGVMFNEILSASQSEAGIISTSTATNLLRSTAQQLIRPGADKVASSIGLKR